MLLVLSPAKRLDFTPPPLELPVTEPQMRAETARLAAVARTLKARDLKRMMSLSDSLAELNVARFKAFRLRGEFDAVPAALAFAGDVYVGLKARGLSADDLAFAQEHLRILSGLYGLLRPLDRIQPYRLEMGVRLQTERGGSLYDFWGDRLAKALNKAGKGQADPTVVNLASQEYFGAVDRKALKLPLVTCHFREEKDGESKIISFFAKQARGMMARWAVERRVEQAEALKGFDAGGYAFRPDQSDATDWVFARPQPPSPAARPEIEA